MSLPIVFRNEALSDLLAARDWYDKQRDGLGDQFVGDFERFVEKIHANPDKCETVLPKTRRGKFRRFPYVLYYRVFADRLEVLGVFHGSRDPKLWQERISDQG